jgi:ABC-type glycerol-3-phosphate transport system permease component
MKTFEAKRWYTWLIYSILIITSVASLLPLMYLVSTAFKPMNEILIYPPRFFVRHPTLKGFHDLAYVLGETRTPFTRYLFNSIVVTALTVVASILFSTLGGYATAKHNFPGKDLFFFLVVSGLMISPHVTLIPRYMVLKELNVLNTYWALILPWLANSYGLFLMKQFIEPIPEELIESAKMDGAGEFKIFFYVIVPLVKPAWLTLTIFVFTWIWNDYVSPITYLTSDSMMTLPVVMSRIAGVTIERIQAASAASLITILPTILVFIFLQRYVVETMVYSGLKG